MRNVSDKSFREYQYTHFTFTNSVNGALYEIIWKNMAKPDKSNMTIIKGACALHAG
jgi:hypothetical protein